jgi:hypothetical protein
VTAVVAEDLRQALRHWALVAWLVLSVVLAAVWLAAPMQGGSAGDAARTVATAPTASAFAGRVLRWHLVWAASLAIAWAASGLPTEAGVAGEAVLSRGISRRQYFLGKAAARMAAVAAVAVLAAGPVIGLAGLRFTNDLTLVGVAQGLLSTAGVLALVAAFAYAGGVWFKTALAAAAVMWMAVYGAGIAAAILELPAYSPLVFADQMVAVLQGATVTAKHHLVATALVAAFVSLAISLGFFSRKDV